MAADIFFFDRDLSWLSFNERVLMEAEDNSVPLLERISFLSIFSSNLDEFYRVRMPALVALHKLYDKEKVDKKVAGNYPDVAAAARTIIHEQQNRFGRALLALIPVLEANGISLLYHKPIPLEILPEVTHYFFTQVIAFLQPVFLSDTNNSFFPENNKLYLVASGTTGREGGEGLVIVNVPSDHLPRFFSVAHGERKYVVFLDDIIKAHIHMIPGVDAEKCHTVKITRDAELNLSDEYAEDLAEMIEKQIARRDAGLATRFLYEPEMPKGTLSKLVDRLNLTEAVVMEGGRYHNLKDLNAGWFNVSALKYPPWQPVRHPASNAELLLNYIAAQDILLHTPYHSYDTVLRFFNEAAISADVEEIYLTMYRVASDSRIVNALLSAAHNGKKVTVLAELKARFDEANNIKWAKRLKKAGVHVMYTPNDLKVHAKIALVKRKAGSGITYLGLLATGNLNENTARFYTDHILMTGDQDILKEVELLFKSFGEKPTKKQKNKFRYLLVAQYNLLEKFVELIDREIMNAKLGLPAGIIIKLNNLEERVLIRKLYEASNAGVQIQLIIRSICCLVPGVPGMSENITVRRIVDRFLEHGRIYIFHNNGREEVFLGSADWMNRNIYKRIEVCFPLRQEELKKEVLEMINLQLQDNVKAVALDENLKNVRMASENDHPVQSQQAIYDKLRSDR